MSDNSLDVAAHYILAGQHDRALETLSQLDGDSADSPRARELRGFALYGAERFTDARRVASDALQDDPDSTVLLYLLSLTTEQLGELGESEAAILAALELEPEDPELLCQYASVCMRAGQLDKAERLVGVASAIEPRSPHVLSARISLAYLRGDDRAARGHTEELLAMNPEDVQGHRMLGVLEMNRGRMAAAAERLGEAVRYDPSHQPTADKARLVKRRSRVWWAPLNAIGRLGVVGSWVVAMGIIFGLRGLGFTTAATIATVVWLVICIVSWVAPRN